MNIDLITVVIPVFLLAGFVKGVVGVGLPTLSLALLSLFLSPAQAVPIILLPSLFTNVWQALGGGELKTVGSKIWMYLLAAVLTIGVGGYALLNWRAEWITAALGVLICIYAASTLLGIRFPDSTKMSKASTIGFGIANGVLTGMTGTFVVPGVMYLQGLGLSRQQQVQAMGLLFLSLTLALLAMLWIGGALSMNLSLMSSFAIIPALTGMFVGRKVASRLPDALFRPLFMIALLALGASLVLRSILF